MQRHFLHLKFIQSIKNNKIQLLPRAKTNVWAHSDIFLCTDENQGNFKGGRQLDIWRLVTVQIWTFYLKLFIMAMWRFCAKININLSTHYNLLSRKILKYCAAQPCAEPFFPRQSMISSWHWHEAGSPLSAEVMRINQCCILKVVKDPLKSRSWWLQ